MQTGFFWTTSGQQLRRATRPCMPTADRLHQRPTARCTFHRPIDRGRFARTTRGRRRRTARPSIGPPRRRDAGVVRNWRPSVDQRPLPRLQLSARPTYGTRYAKYTQAHLIVPQEDSVLIGASFTAPRSRLRHLFGKDPSATHSRAKNEGSRTNDHQKMRDGLVLSCGAGKNAHSGLTMTSAPRPRCARQRHSNKNNQNRFTRYHSKLGAFLNQVIIDLCKYVEIALQHYFRNHLDRGRTWPSMGEHMEDSRITRTPPFSNFTSDRCRRPFAPPRDSSPS